LTAPLPTPDPASPTPYDLVEYPGGAHPQTHPDRLATLATLFGLRPAPPQSCRVLEIGCGDGANLIPMAYTLPDSQFFGFDLAPTAIERGRLIAKEVGLANLRLEAMDLMALPEGLGQFDYIVAHGFHSWVPEPVREALQAAIRRHLAPQGVAYVSYNVHPGGHLRQMVREMMLHHVRDIVDPGQRIAQARALMGLVAARATKDDPDPYLRLMSAEFDRLRTSEDGQLFHDDLAPINAPEYFHQFVARAGRHDLQFLAEADFFEMQDGFLPPSVRQSLAGLDDRLLEREQYLDFLKCRRFRQTLLCRKEVQPERRLRPEIVERFSASAALQIVSGNDTDADQAAAVVYTTGKGTQITTNSPAVKCAIRMLREQWPRAIPWTELAAGAGTDATTLREFLLGGYAAGLLELHQHQPAFAATPGLRPRASRLARLQVRHGPTVTNLVHANVHLAEPMGRALLELLDGRRDRRSIVESLARSLANGALPMPDGSATPTLASAIEVVDGGLDDNLGRLARLALLEA
jgi:methyltransferase-like protein/ubiquinone/menaquinone biosynthesis C-methylase UbiE